MMEVGRVCMKIAGRDANKMCVVVEVLDGNYVLIDGETRRKKCNIKHLEPTKKVIKIKSGDARAEIKKAFSDLGFGFFDPKSKKPEPRLRKMKAKKEVVDAPKTKAKKETKQETKKAEKEDKKETTTNEKDTVKEK
jgi:large subunit ribosomal protein L14e